MKTGFVATNDGVELYYASHGTGPVTLVCCNGVGVSTYFWRHINEAFSDKYRIITWDYIGHGRSSAPVSIQETDLTIYDTHTTCIPYLLNYKWNNQLCC